MSEVPSAARLCEDAIASRIVTSDAWWLFGLSDSVTRAAVSGVPGQMFLLGVEGDSQITSSLSLAAA
jgi:hypothetical protein